MERLVGGSFKVKPKLEPISGLHLKGGAGLLWEAGISDNHLGDVFASVAT